MKTYHPNQLRILYASLLIACISELFFVLDVLEDTFEIDLPLVNLFNHTLMESLATLALGFAIVFIVNNIRALLAHQKQIEESVQVASGHLQEVIEEYFKQWALTPSEKEVAMMLFKGYSSQEIADVRNTKIGTVKNQSSSIYQKAGVKNRNELFSMFVEELLNESSKYN
jgi:DNA-binding CsgD family transcriptional regulator